MKVLIVKRSFGDYARGDVITGDAIAEVEKVAAEGSVSRQIDLAERHEIKAEPAEPEHAPEAAEEH